MSKFIARSLLGLVSLLAAVPAMAQSSAQERSGRSPEAQSDDQTTRQDESQYNQPSSGQQGQARQENEREGLLGRFRSEDDPRRREMRQLRQEDRQDRRQSFSNREPAIGVTVVERGGLGVRVVRVQPQSPAAQAGIRPGDTILEVDGRSVQSPPQLVAVIQESEAGESAELSVIRSGREYQIPVRLATREQALPPELRQGERDFGRPPSAGEQYGQSWQPEWYDQREQSAPPWQRDQQQQQYSQAGQYGQRPWDQQQSAQYGQQQYRQQPYDRQQGAWDGQQGRFTRRQPSDQFGQQYGPYSDQYSGSTQQAYYGEAEQNYADQDRRFGGQDRQFGDRQLGDRLAARLEALENRFEQLTQRLERLQQQRGDWSSDSRQSFEDDQDVSRQADRRTEE